MADATLVVPRALSCLIAGESKAGKSLFSVSGPAPRVLMDVESSWRFLPLKPIIWDPQNDPPVPNDSWDTAIVSVKKWDDAQRALDKLQSRPHGFNSASLDSVSELQYRNIEKVAKGNQPQLQEWGTIYRQVGAFCRQLRDMTEHPNYPLRGVIVTSMAKQFSDERIWRPFLQGQMRDVIPYLFDIIAFLEKKRELQNREWVEVRDLYTEQTQPQRFIAGGRITGRITSPLRMPLVTGKTIDEIAAKNITFDRMIDMVFAMNAADMRPATPIPDTTPKVPVSPQGAPK